MIWTVLPTLIWQLLLVTLRVAVVVLIGKLILRGVLAAVRASMSGVKGAGATDRIQTIVAIVRVIGNAVLYSMALFLFLEAIGIDIQPILAGAGVLGIMAGLGAQTLIKDFVSGILISVEDQYRVGDRVRVNTLIEGTVTAISMRLTTLRGPDGEVHHILNSAINMVTNYSRK